MWEFSVGLYMIRVWPGSLLFAAVYGVVESASVAAFGYLPAVAGALLQEVVDLVAIVSALRALRAHKGAERDRAPRHEPAQADAAAA